MRRAFLAFVVVGVSLAVIGGVVYGFRKWGASRPSMSAMPAPAVEKSADSAAATPRGDVTIDPRRQQLIGVRTVAVTRATMDQAVRTVGAIRYDETRLTDVNVKVDGWIRDLYVDSTGQRIEKGQPLFTLYSPDVLNAEREFLLALKMREQVQQAVIPEVLERADALIAAARQRLVLWDVPAEEIRALEEKREAPEAVVFRAPVSGVVVDKQAVKGLHIMSGQSLYKVVDLSSVWVEADVYENEISAVRVGDTASVVVDAYPHDKFTGRIVYIYPYLDDKTRTNKVRFELANRDGRLKPGMFANVELKTRGVAAVMVPNDAVLDSGAEQVAFVSQGDGRFEPRPVKIGRRLGDMVQVLDGLKEGEQVAAGATFFLDSESQLRASLQGYQAAAAPATASGGAAPAVDISFRAISDPPKTGENQFEAVVKDAAGKTVDDADVTLQLFMPAMPTMNMPAMRSEAKLSPVGAGVYRGSGQVMMAGRWDATVTVTRGGQRLGTKQLPMVAR
jgi:RND family efflux transporter MFP subunit